MQRNIENRLLRPAFAAFLGPALQALFKAPLASPSRGRDPYVAEPPLTDAAAAGDAGTPAYGGTMDDPYDMMDTAAGAFSFLTVAKQYITALSR